MFIKYLLETRVWIQHFGYTLLFNLCDRRNICEVTQGGLRIGLGLRKIKCLVCCPLGWGEERGWQLKYTNAWQWDLESFWVGEHISVLGLRVACLEKGMQACTSLPHSCPMHFIHVAAPELYSFWKTSKCKSTVFLSTVSLPSKFSNVRMSCGRKGKITIMWWPWACNWHLKCKWSYRTESLNLCYVMLKPGSVRTELNYWHLVGIRELENLWVSEQTEIPSLQNL